MKKKLWIFELLYTLIKTIIFHAIFILILSWLSFIRYISFHYIKWILRTKNDCNKKNKNTYMYIGTSILLHMDIV